MNLKPYVGITDFMLPSHVDEMLKIVEASESSRVLHVGVMISRKTLLGEETKWTKAFPPKENINDIFYLDGNPRIYNCLHYVDFRSDTSGCWRDLLSAVGWGNLGLNALQLDMRWPQPEDIAQVMHASRMNFEVILQIGKQALEDVGDDPERLVAKLTDYQHVVQRVLIDKSMGKGLTLDPSVLLPFVRAVSAAYPSLGIAVAGGLGPNTIDVIRPIAEEFPDISIDAQGQLRPSTDALDPVDWGMAGKYLTRALAILK